MNATHVAITSALLLAVAGGCRREEPKPSEPLPPPTPKTAPQAAPPAASPGMSSTEPGRTAGQTVDDVTVTAKVKAALLQAPDVKGTDINVDTVNGGVTLKGAVETQAQSDRAASIAKGIEGVKNVQNTLTVKGPAK